MTLSNMRLNGVRMVTATCEVCGRSADVNVDNLPETLTVPEAGQRLRCSSCGAKTISTRPAWHTARRAVQTFGQNGRRGPSEGCPAPSTAPAIALFDALRGPPQPRALMQRTAVCGLSVRVWWRICGLCWRR